MYIPHDVLCACVIRASTLVESEWSVLGTGWWCSQKRLVTPV